MLENWLEQLAEELEMDSNVPQNQDGVFLLELAQKQKIFLKEHAEGAYFYTHLASYPKNHEGEILEHLMYANLFAQGVGEANAIGLDEEKNLLTLSSEIPQLTSYEEFTERLEQFANFADYWKEALEQAYEKEAPPLFEM